LVVLYEELSVPNTDDCVRLARVTLCHTLLPTRKTAGLVTAQCKPRGGYNTFPRISSHEG